MENNILQHKLAVQGNIEKAFDVDFEKGRTGVYSDNAKNRRLHRVGQQYGNKKEQEQTAGGEKGGKKEEPTDHAKHAAGASDEALRRAAADENADEKVRNAAKAELEKRGKGGENKGGKDSKDKGGNDKGVEEKKEENNKLNKNTATAVENAFSELADFYNNEENEQEDAYLDADDKFLNTIADLVINDGLKEDEFYKIKDSNPEWKYGLDTYWGDVEDVVNEKRENEREKRYAIKDIVDNGSNKTIDSFMDKNTEYFKDVLESYGVKDLFGLQDKLEEEHEDDEKDPYGYKEYSKIYVKCLKQIPAKEFKKLR